MSRLSDHNTVLEKQVNMTKENTDSLARQVTSVMNDLYSKFVPHAVLPAEQAEQFSNALAQSPDMLKAMQPVAVLASAVATATTTHAQAVATSANTELHESQAKLRLLTQQYRNLGGQTDIWSAPAAHPAHQQQAAPAVEVAASAGPTAVQSAVPDWLKGRIAAYDSNASASSKIFSSDFQHGGPRK